MNDTMTEINEMTAAMMLSRLERMDTPRSIELFDLLNDEIDRNEDMEIWMISMDLYTAIYETLTNK